MDTKILTRIQMLERDAQPGLMVWAYHNAATDQFLLLPDADFGSKAFTAAMENAAKDGASLIAVLALKKAAPGDEALIEYELMRGASEKTAQRARLVFRDTLIGAGVLTMETAHS